MLPNCLSQFSLISKQKSEKAKNEGKRISRGIKKTRRFLISPTIGLSSWGRSIGGEEEQKNSMENMKYK
jgi:hypothetical protein